MIGSYENRSAGVADAKAVDGASGSSKQPETKKK
jgi:hypothetical protein